MGNPYSKYVKIDLYKWSSSEFPQEYALVYTSLDDTSRTTTLRFSVNTDVVLCGVADNMCKDHPIRFHAKVTALRDNSNGDCNFGEVVVAQHGCDISTKKDNIPRFFYQGDESFLGNDVWLIHKEHKLDGVNLQRKYWEFCHSLEIGVRRTLKYYARVQCNKETGLMVGFSGPYLYKGFYYEDGLGLQSKNEVLGEPPKALIENFEREWKERNEYTFLKRDQNGSTLPSARATRLGNTGAQATEKVFNIGAQFQGSGNGAKYENCNIVMKYKAAA